MSARCAKDQPSGFSNRIETVAVAGLLMTGRHTITGLTRIGSSSTKLPGGMKYAAVNYEDEQSLVAALAALAGQQFLVALSVMDPPGTNSRLIRAAATAGVPYIMPNCFGSDIVNKELMVERCTAFSLTMGPGWFGFDFANRRMTYDGDGNTKVNASTWEQCARAAAELVSLKELPEDGKPLYIASFLVSRRDNFESWKRVWLGFNGVLGLPMEEDLDECTRVAKRMIERDYATEVTRKTFLESIVKIECTQ
ncbi:putative oxidoreductase CipA [Coniochaeta sp. 2T2.1]|nr:putative oxidoreductase CipA [Coniochaeta sp. 2T2.1]